MNYCDHFISLVSPKVPSGGKYVCTQCKTLPPFVWICLSKGCGYMACQNNKFKHMYDHQQCTIQYYSEYKKKNHCIFINPINAQIKCITCKIQIYDFEYLSQEEFKKYKLYIDPFVLRQKYLPSLQENNLFQTAVQLENSTAHKKSNKGLCGLFKKRNNSSINCIIQYFSNIPYYKSFLKHVKVDPNKSENKKFVFVFSDIIKRIWSGQMRCISSNEFSNLVFQQLPKYKGYQRKDPFQLFTLILNTLHDQFKFFQFSNLSKENLSDPIQDEWKILKNVNNSYKQYSGIISPLVSQLKYVYECKKCKQISTFTSQIMGVKLDIPKKKRVQKEIQSEYSKRKYVSPQRSRSKSLFDRILGTNEELPLTILQLYFNFIDTIQSSSSQKLKQCKKCVQKMEKKSTAYTKLPNILFLHIPRMNKDGYTINSKFVQFPTDTLNMQGFVDQSYQGNVLYDFHSAVCITKDNQFITVAKNCKNKQKYEFFNQNIKMNTQNYAPYLLCYMIKNKNNPLYHNIKSNISIKIAPDVLLPQFWLEQLKYFQPGPLLNQRICRHSCIKPRVQTKTVKVNQIPNQIYEALVDRFGGRHIKNVQCQICLKQLLSLNKRRKVQKQFVTKLDTFKCNSYCMISCAWLKKWSQYLYKKKDYNYFIKNSPLPGPVNNNNLLENGNKCKLNLKKGQDYKIINFYVWIFFRQLYGGGPQIQYKAKNNQPEEVLNQDSLAEIAKIIKELKDYLTQQFYLNIQIIESPTKTSGGKSVKSTTLFNKSVVGDDF